MSRPDCEQVRTLLPSHARGDLPLADGRALDAHIAGCERCARDLAEERALSELLRSRLQARPAPEALRRALTERVTHALTTEAALTPPAALTPTARAHASRRGVLASLWTLSVAAALALGFFAGGQHAGSPLLREALNDHLRVLYAQSPVEIPNGGLHQVKPWFTGRVDFAPDISFVGDDAFPMLGGSVGYFLDRKTASFVFKRRLHTITLHVFRPEGFEWPRGESQRVAGKRVQLASEAGFHLVLWQANGLGHVLVSDISRAELLSLTAKLLD